MAILVQTLIDNAKADSRVPVANLTRFTPADLVRFVNDGLVEIGATGDLEADEVELQLVAGQRRYDLSEELPGLRMIEACAIAGSNLPLVRYDPTVGVEEGSAEMLSRPTRFGEKNEFLYLDPIPDAAYILNVLVTGDPAEVALAGTIYLPRRYTMALEWFVKGRMELREKDFESAKVNMDLWQQFLESARETEVRRKNRAFGGPIKQALHRSPTNRPRFYIPGQE